MIKRSDLEVPRTCEQMTTLFNSYAEDFVTYPSEDVHLRKGIIKDLLEEYRPLCALVCNMPNACRAYLAPQSNQGPDAFIELNSGEKVTIQITTADQSRQEAMGRKALSRGQSHSKVATKERNRETGEIKQWGGMRLREDRDRELRRWVEAILSAIKRKSANFQEGTEMLLVSHDLWLGSPPANYSWRDDLKDRVRTLDNIPYKYVHLANRDELIMLKGPDA